MGRGAEVGGSAEWEVGGSVAVEGCVVVEVGVVVDGKGEDEVNKASMATVTKSGVQDSNDSLVFRWRKCLGVYFIYFIG